MAGTMVHRGPDDEGYHFSGPLGFGFRRLSIIDLEGGHQPMSDADEKIWVVFNGEIYNFQDIRKELESFGHVFRTRSDTEVLVHGYKRWGEDLFNHLNGMFGVAIWDSERKKLLLARDPMGIKLVYYRMENGTVTFGSEIRPIRAAFPGKPEIDPAALNLFLRYRYTPSPLTLFQGIRKLAPGTMIVFEDGKSRLSRWYRNKPVLFSPPPSEDEAKETLLGLYRRAVKRHLISDVPVGLLLSGGVDSGLLLGLMNPFGDSWPTYTAGYGKSFKDDELSDAAESARIYSAKNIPVKLDYETFEKNLPKIVSFLEEPIASSSIVPMYFVCERARQDVKVALVGQGPDELFGGYTRHLGVRYGAQWRNLPSWLRKSVAASVKKLPRNETLKRGIYSLDIPERLKRYQCTFSILPGESIDELFQPALLDGDAGEKVLEYWAEIEPLMENVDELGGFQMLEIRSSLPDELLMYADKLSMAHGLEVRVPYLDREVVEYVERLPANFKIRYGKRKWLHRKVCAGFLPKEILRRKKRGFAVNVVDEWFRGSLNRKMENFLLDNDSLMNKYLRSDKINLLYETHKTGENDNHKILFSLVVFENWLRALQ
jgi:asparagine synthase (glutamine-hydrolysing)